MITVSQCDSLGWFELFVCLFFKCAGGEIASTFDHPELVKLGHCKLIEEVMIGEDMLIHFSGVDMGMCWANKSTNLITYPSFYFGGSP